MTPFYIERLLGDIAYLSGEEAHHSTKVLRKKPGEELIGIDGAGQMLVCKILSLGKDQVELQVIERHLDWGEKPQRVYLLISPLHKPDRFEWLVEKAVELGVTDIVPYLGKHTVKTGLRIDRLERIMVAALKQCMRSRLPEIHAALPLAKALKVPQADLSLIGHSELGKPMASLSVDWAALRSVAVLIGPEGDFSHEEVEAAVENGFQAVSLGHNRLRSETAAIHLLGLVKNFLNY